MRPTWRIHKPAVATDGGVVAAQNLAAAEVGADILVKGGNAVDAAVATSFALGVLEPWMSGIGGGGFMVVHRAGEATAEVVDFAMVAPAGLDPADYPLTGAGADSDLFGWPAVRHDRNVRGPHAMAVPGQVAGMALALDRFGTIDWAAALAPAVALARDGLILDWFATLSIATAAGDLARYPASRDVYLPDGLPPNAPAGYIAGRLPLGALGETLARLAAAGPRDFYHGETAAKIVADIAADGGRIAAADLAGYRARVVPPLALDYRGVDVSAAPGLSAGPTLAAALAALGADWQAADGVDGATCRAYAASLAAAYADRLATMGDVDDGAAPGCTTHLNVVDRDGTMVSLTQTLLSRFGSRVVLPATGVLMNNGIMWFDPRPGRPNSMRPGRRPLTNMCPVVLARDGAPFAALGASGGRHIVGAVLQTLSFLVDHGMSLEAAFHHPRLDVSGPDGAMAPPELLALDGVRDALDGIAREVPHVLFPGFYASPSGVLRDAATGRNFGMADVFSPWSGAIAARFAPDGALQ